MTIKDPCKSCVDCGRKACQKSNEALYPDFCLTRNTSSDDLANITAEYNDDAYNNAIMMNACKIQAETYGTITRVEETILMAKAIGCKRIGIATCTALLKESQTLTRVLRANGFEVFSACCKVGAISKKDLNIPDEIITQGPNICNPIMQAEMINEAEIDLCIVMGLCVGHDILFQKYVKVATTTLVVKDRVLAHNSCAALYQTHSFYKNILNLNYSRLNHESG